MSRPPASSARALILSTMALLATLGLVACGSSTPTESPVAHTSFAVLSDTHVHDVNALGASGPDWDADLAADRKMWAQSAELIDAAIADLKAKPIDFVLVTGDLTKDGEVVNHQLMATKLAQLKAAGKKVFVIPGNHDVNNPYARDYTVTPAVKATSVSSAEFKTIYADYGYGTALYTDTSSLSYVAEPVPGVWIVAIDSCRWAENTVAPITSGKVGAATQAWIVERLQEARAKGKTVIGMMHHGVVEHFAGQSAQFPEYLVADRDLLGKTFTDHGMNVVFTGHFHANDVAKKDFTAAALHDVETGSLVTAPSPYRTVSVDVPTSTLTISTSVVTAIPSHPTDFKAWSDEFLRIGLTGISNDTLKHDYGLDDATIALLTPLIVEGMVAHYAGDEDIESLAEPLRGNTKAMLAYLRASPDPTTRALGDAILGLWTDPPPGDNDVVLKLKP